MDRRSLLATAGTTAGFALAGCLGGTDSPDDEDDAGGGGNGESSPGDDGDGPYDLGETATVEGTGDVTVESVAVQRSVIEHHLWREVHEPADAQMLVVESTVENSEDVEFALHARFDGQRVDSETRVTLLNDGRRYAVSVPIGPAEDAAVVLEVGDEPAWRIPEPTLADVASAPQFHLHDATIREDDGETALDLTVENRGDHDGTFRAVVVSAVVADGDAAVRVPVPAGETVTETVRNSVVENWSSDEDFEHDVTPDTRRFAVQYP